MKTKKVFQPEDKLSDLIDENQHLILVMCRSGLSMGYADKTVAQVCDEDSADCQTFLAISNFVSGKPYKDFKISLPSIIQYLERTHSYFLDFMLPSIRRKLIESTDASANHDVTYLLLKFFDDYVDEVKNHMDYENRTIFNYAKQLMDGNIQSDVHISDYMKGHTSMVQKLNELKDIFVRHYHQKSTDVLNSALFDIMMCEQDLMGHCDIENHLFIPEVMNLEKSLLKKSEKSKGENQKLNDSRVEDLSEREKEIIRGVARGKANKEIADELNLSVNTITTYRRNISSKLGIHSAAGLTIFALLNDIIAIKDCPLRD